MKRIFMAVLVTALVVVPVMAQAGTVVRGTNGDDVIHGNKINPPGSMTIYGLRGDDRIWGGKGHDEVYGGRGDDRLHNFQAASGLIAGGPGFDKCVIGVNHKGDTNVTVRGCELVVERAKQGHGGH